MRKQPTDRCARLRGSLQSGIFRLARACGKGVPAVCLGYSGGMDSSLLLHLLRAQAALGRISLTALHVNHGLSPRAGQWAAHCNDVCLRHGVDLRIVEVRVTRNPGESLEEQARAARYLAYASVEADAVALAHHADDQAETVLLQLLRGAGPKGLAAMAEISPGRMRATLWRPLLEFARGDLAECARHLDISWIDDESNLDTALRRNFLRQRILPVLEQCFPAPTRMIARAARLQGEAAALLDDLADADLASLGEGNRLDLAGMRLLSRQRQANMLRRWITLAGTRAPSSARLAALLSALAGDGEGLEWVHENLRVTSRDGRLFLAPRSAP